MPPDYSMPVETERKLYFDGIQLFNEHEFFEADVHTHASAHARLRDDTLTTTGDAYRNPKDPSAPLVGEEIAAARALIALGTDLLMAASANIEKSTHHPVHLYR